MFFLLLLLILFTKLQALWLPIDNNNTIKNIGEVEPMQTLLTTESTTILNNETEKNEIIEENFKNETKEENETRKEKYNTDLSEYYNKNEAKETTEVIEPENFIKTESTFFTTSTTTPFDPCLNVECSIESFPDECPEDSVPVLSFITNDNSSSQKENNCCKPAKVECKCDLQKCFVPACPEGSELLHLSNGILKPGHCCDQFECRPIELNCQNVHCPDTSSLILDLYSPDGKTCPEDSYRPKSYIPTGSCCPIVPQCQCKLSICEPAICLPEQKLIILKRGRGEPGQCCDEFKCVNDDENEVEEELFFDENNSNSGCRHEDHIYAKGEHWNVAPCQECECSAAGVALCRRMECPVLSSNCHWIGLSPGDCCPICLGCSDDNGKNYLPGENWERDGCSNCTCEGENFDFHWQCQKFICQTECEHPRPPIIGSECCPVCEDGPTIALGKSFFSSCPSLIDCELICPFGLYQNTSTSCFECKCIEEEENIIQIEENKQKIILKEEKIEEKQNKSNTDCQPLLKENCLYNERAYDVGEHFQDGPFRNCSCLSGGMLKCVEVHCPPCSSHSLEHQNFISTTSTIEENKEIQTTTQTIFSEMNWCLLQCLQQQQNENKKEQMKLAAFEQGNEQILIFENRQLKNFTEDNNTKQWHQINFSQPHWLFIIAAFIVGIPAFSLLLLFIIYLLLITFNSKYRHCRKERNIEASTQFINNKWNFSQLLPRIKQQNKKKSTNKNKNINSTSIASNNDSLVVKVSLLGINKNNEEEK